jgi:ferredoxin-thioredoxin reductase catalytic chain
MDHPKQASIDKMWKYAEKFAEKSGTRLHPQREITEAVVLGLAANIDNYGRPICPCNFYPAKNEDGSWPEGLYLPREEEAKRRDWICACDERDCLSFTMPGRSMFACQVMRKRWRPSRSPSGSASR